MVSSKWGACMRVLFSAYACEPNRGSEQEVGWQRAAHMRAFADEVWVLTRANNRQAIEEDPLSQTPGLYFIYYDLPKWMRMLKKSSWLLYIYVVLWQRGAYGVAARYHRDKPFDRVYHLTFQSMQFGSRMGELGIPFVVGPIGGGERAPFRLRRGMPLRGWFAELLRDLGILFQRFNPLARQAFSTAERIYVTTPQSLQLVPAKWHFKTRIHEGIAIEGPAIKTENLPRPTSPRFVFAGRLLHWKGVHLAIRALAESRETVREATLTIFGVGPEEVRLQNLAKKLGVADAVRFAGYTPRLALLDSLTQYTALVFPSLHDSGGMIVLEALSRGVPVVCLDLGGPGMLVNSSCGIVVPTSHAGEAKTVTRIAGAMIALGTIAFDDAERMSLGAIARSSELSWEKLTEHIAQPGRG
jgi:glycosyltransferase involved in cell wall biosynthesis